MVVTPSGKRLPGNPKLARGPWAVTDHRNSLEQVVLNDPEPGEYRIQILAYNTSYENRGSASSWRASSPPTYCPSRPLRKHHGSMATGIERDVVVTRSTCSDARVFRTA